MVEERELIEDHEAVDSNLERLISILDQGKMDPNLFSIIYSGLRTHIFLEEEHSFPAVLARDPSLSGRIAGLEMEHASICLLLDRIHREVETGNVVRSPKFIQEIYDILQSHNAQEEKYVYPVILEAQINDGPHLSEAKIPDDWICRKLRKRGSP